MSHVARREDSIYDSDLEKATDADLSSIVDTMGAARPYSITTMPVLAPEVDAFESASLNQHILRQIRAGRTHLIVDLTWVSSLEPALLNSLISCSSSLQRLGGCLKLSGLRNDLVSEAERVRLSAHCGLHPSVAEAIQSIQSDRSSDGPTT